MIITAITNIAATTIATITCGGIYHCEIVVIMVENAALIPIIPALDMPAILSVASIAFILKLLDTTSCESSSKIEINNATSEFSKDSSRNNSLASSGKSL